MRSPRQAVRHPVHTDTFAMVYNKDLLKAAGDDKIPSEMG